MRELGCLNQQLAPGCPEHGTLLRMEAALESAVDLDVPLYLELDEETRCAVPHLAQVMKTLQIHDEKQQYTTWLALWRLNRASTWKL